MKEYLFIYLLQLMDILCVLTVFALLIGIIGSIVSSVILSDRFSDDEAINNARLTFKISISLLIAGLLMLFIPTKETLLLMTGTYVTKKTITNERVEKINKIIDLKLDELVKEEQWPKNKNY